MSDKTGYSFLHFLSKKVNIGSSTCANISSSASVGAQPGQFPAPAVACASATYRLQDAYTLEVQPPFFIGWFPRFRTTIIVLGFIIFEKVGF